MGATRRQHRVRTRARVVLPGRGLEAALQVVLAVKSLTPAELEAVTTRTLRAREWLSQSMIAAEAPGWRGATKAHTAGM
jgi:hypothetical protein